MEAALPKARILEIYLNVIEWGDGVWGAEAAARTYFGASASGLSREQAALLAGAIINPRVLNPARPPARLLSRQRLILGRMGSVEPPAPAPVPVPEPEVQMPEGETLPADELPPIIEVPEENSDPAIPLPPEPIAEPIPEPSPEALPQ